MPSGVYLRTEQHRNNISIGCKNSGVGKWMIGRKQSQELIDKRVNHRRGYRHTEKTKLKISSSHKGKKKP